jgi:hypothetical protein
MNDAHSSRALAALLLAVTGLGLGGCGTADRLANVG